MIPAFGFGDERTTDQAIFSLKSDGSYCKGFEEVLNVSSEKIFLFASQNGLAIPMKVHEETV